MLRIGNDGVAASHHMHVMYVCLKDGDQSLQNKNVGPN